MSDSMELGAQHEGDGVTRFLVWAPERRTVEVALERGGDITHVALAPSDGGYFEGRTKAPPGTRYRFRVDGKDAFPDPCSRFQPEGPHGPSLVVDPSDYRWKDEGFPGAKLEGAVMYELHVGTFSEEGTYAGVRRRLPYLKELGVTVVELMPVNTFPGRYNWGYDGTGQFAPVAVYGTPDELRELVDDAHAHGIAVILDVVYNHFGPDGNYLWKFTKSYFSDRYKGEWGDPLNFDGPRSEHVRRFFVENVQYWIREFHLDGLRFDATPGMYDASERHIVSELVTAARAAAPHKRLLLVAENEPQDVRLVTPQEEGGHGCDTMWIDDFHHSARVALTFRREAYTRDYRGTAQELVSCARHSSLYQGQFYAWQDKGRGTPLRGHPPQRFVFFLQDHDQVANFLGGDRLHTYGEPRLRALTVLWLLLPQTPMLFMGQEFFASSPFHYFVDHKPELQQLVIQGRRDFVSQFRSAEHAFEEEGYRAEIGDEAFTRSKLDWTELEKHAKTLLLHKELLRLRREVPHFARQDLSQMDGSVLTEQALVLRFYGDAGDDRLVLLNLGADLNLDPCPEPLLAPPPGRKWAPVLSSKEIRFGGHGAVFPDGLGPWSIQGQVGLVLTSAPAGELAVQIRGEGQA